MNDLLPGLSQSLNAHPVFVHFPIALWTFGLVVWALGWFLKNQAFMKSASWTFHAGTLTAFVAVMTGFLASNSLGHDSAGHDFVHVHRNFMITATALGLLTSILLLVLPRKASWTPWILAGALLSTVVVTTLGADRGALLVYKYGMGTRNPAPATGSGHSHGEAGNSDHDQPANTNKESTSNHKH